VCMRSAQGRDWALRRSKNCEFEFSRKVGVELAAVGFQMPPTEKAVAADVNEMFLGHEVNGAGIGEAGVEIGPELGKVGVRKGLEFDEGF
jgi:hypothetical protein